jgi:tetratricopeptide (TPR) repeat protein
MSTTDTAGMAGMFKRAMAAYEAGQFADAERHCVAMLASEPEDFDARRLLAVTQFRGGRRVEALASYDRLLAIRPDYAEGHNNRAVVLADLERFEEALASYDKAALGKPVWILLPFTPDWRWLVDRNTTRWYPSARLFRQAGPGDWDEVVARVKAALPDVVGRARA